MIMILLFSTDDLRDHQVLVQLQQSRILCQCLVLLLQLLAQLIDLERGERGVNGQVTQWSTKLPLQNSSFISLFKDGCILVNFLKIVWNTQFHTCHLLFNITVGIDVFCFEIL